MKKNRINRSVSMGTASIEDAHDRPGLVIRAQVGLLKLLAGGTYREVVRIGQLIRASGLDWTVVRVPWLTNQPATGQLHVGYYGIEKRSNTLSRGDMATFFINQLTDTTWVQKAPGVSNQ